MVRQDHSGEVSDMVVRYGKPSGATMAQIFAVGRPARDLLARAAAPGQCTHTAG
jgi:hypothetical protein